MTVFSTTN